MEKIANKMNIIKKHMARIERHQDPTSHIPLVVPLNLWIDSKTKIVSDDDGGDVAA